MNKPVLKMPIEQSDVLENTNKILLYIKMVTQELTEAYFQLRTIQEWCDHDSSIRNNMPDCARCRKNLKEKEDV